MRIVTEKRKKEALKIMLQTSCESTIMSESIQGNLSKDNSNTAEDQEDVNEIISIEEIVSGDSEINAESEEVTNEANAELEVTNEINAELDEVTDEANVELEEAADEVNAELEEAADEIVEVEAKSKVKNKNASNVKKRRLLPRGRRSKRGAKKTKRNSSTKSSTELEEESDQQEGETDESQQCVEETNPEITPKRIFHSCKLCKKDFSSEFILCLHLQIHEKVGSVQTVGDDVIASENVTFPVKKALSSKQQKNVGRVKGPAVNKRASNGGETCTTKPSESSIPLVKNDTTGILNKNFVENLKKNLSLAMNRKL